LFSVAEVGERQDAVSYYDTEDREDKPAPAPARLKTESGRARTPNRRRE